MKVLIGITSKNRIAILPKAIISAASQRYTDKVVSVFDDASIDGTQSLVNQFPNVLWTLSRETKGYLYARNFFLKTPGIDYYCSLDDDSWFLQDDGLENAINYLNAHPDVAVIALDILSPDNNPVSRPSEIIPLETNMFIGCGHVLRVNVVNQVGAYAPNPGYYGGEEKDLCIRLIDAGYKIVKLQGVYVWHDKTMVARNQRLQHRSGVCNDLVFTWRRTPLVYLFPALCVKCYKHIYFSATYTKGFLFKFGILGLFDFFRYLVTFKIKREPVSVRGFSLYRKYNH